MKILQIPDPVLYKTAAPVMKITPVILRLIADMSELMRLHSGLGLAAPQTGESLCLFIYQRENGRIRTVINPATVRVSGETSVEEEGCLSIPGMIVSVSRPKVVVMAYLTEKGEERVITASGWEARVIQHEIDHLRGVTILDGAKPENIRILEI